MLRYIVCTVLLIGFIYGLTHLLRGLSISMEFWPFMALCAITGTVLIALGFAWDRFERSRARR